MVDRFSRWVSSIDAYAGPDFEYLNERGVIPPGCIVESRKGKGKDKGNGGAGASERRPGAYREEGVRGGREEGGEEEEEGLDLKSAELEG